MQDDFFNNHYPMYINYGRIGFLIAHGIAHGFDTNGIQIDKEGYHLKRKNLSERYLENKTNCVLEQYKKYTDGKVKILFFIRCILIFNCAYLIYFSYHYY